MGLSLYAAVELIERTSIPWHVSHRLAETEISRAT
jgi:hypothetical protein